MQQQQTPETQTPEIQSPFLRWLDNFWYHYKWHTLIALFFVLLITVSSVQMCKKNSFDIYIMYAGQHDVKRTSNTGITEYETLLQGLNKHAHDFDADGKTSVSFLPLFLPSGEEIKEITKEDGVEVNTAVIKDNSEIFNTNIVYSNYYLCILSKSLYETYRVISDVEIFVPLASYVEGTDATLYAKDAILLSSTPLGQSAGFADFPEDTVICLRNTTEVSQNLTGAKSREHFENAETVLKRMLGKD